MATDNLYEPYKNEKLSLFQKKLSPSAILPFYGISIPNLRGLAKTFSWQGLDIKWHEDVILYGLSLGLEKAPFDQKISRLNSLLPYLSSWDHTDTITTAFKVNSRDKDAMVDYFKQLTLSSSTFIRRLGIVWLMNNRHSIDYEDALRTIVQADNGDDYYVMMAVSWALSFFAMDGKDITFELYTVSEATKAKTLQKIRESARKDKRLTIKTSIQ